ncbi:uncharacterized protein PG986_007455 [Apiospora aurea]|uniref:Uncharacterized protein n=1 Tax=Apiospora aurea TaxID=335848 RepID=A0ABR1QCM1_9PEZI
MAVGLSLDEGRAETVVNHVCRGSSRKLNIGMEKVQKQTLAVARRITRGGYFPRSLAGGDDRYIHAASQNASGFGFGSLAWPL